MRQCMARVLVAALVILGATVSAAVADTLAWTFKNETADELKLGLYAQDRDRGWPSSETTWSVPPGQTGTVRIECRSGERICYGAWVRNHSRTYWGVGYMGRYECKNGCRSACVRCGEEPRPTRLLLE